MRVRGLCRFGLSSPGGKVEGLSAGGPGFHLILVLRVWGSVYRVTTRSEQQAIKL